MKQSLPFCCFIAIVFLLSSCALQKESATSVSRHHNDNRFLKNVVIHSGSNSINLHKKKSVYPKTVVATQTSADTEILIDSLVWTSDTTLAHFIDNWLGTPYCYGGDTKNGIDCSAFTQALYANVYHTNILRTAHAQYRSCERILNPDSLREGDLVFFKIHHRRISHVGVYLSDGYFVQASLHGVMISNLDDRYWKRYFVCGGRFDEND